MLPHGNNHVGGFGILHKGPNHFTTPSVNPYLFPKGYTVQELQLSGACDWYKLEKLVHGESRLLHLLEKDGLRESAMKLESMQKDLLSHRLAATASDDAKLFLRNNCANDAYISKWRKDFDALDKILSKELKNHKLLPQHAIELRYQAQLLKQQARASLPFTGYYNPVPDVPSVKADVYRPHKYVRRFVYTPSPPRPELAKLLQTGSVASLPTTKLASFL
jgi:hypothetical protein